VKKELQNHLPPIIAIFLSTCLIWILYSIPFVHFLLLFLGLALGTFFLDIDHLVYWYYLKPNLGESQIAKKLILQKKYKDLVGHLALYHKGHTSLIFHHFIFQAVLLVLTFFVLSSTPTIFGKAFCLAIYIHLLVDQISDYQEDPHHLATWLFARSPLKPKVHHLKNYLIFYSSFLPLFLYLLLKTR
jgi:hypothetical protein